MPGNYLNIFFTRPWLHFIQNEDWIDEDSGPVLFSGLRVLAFIHKMISFWFRWENETQAGSNIISGWPMMSCCQLHIDQSEIPFWFNVYQIMAACYYQPHWRVMWNFHSWVRTFKSISYGLTTIYHDFLFWSYSEIKSFLVINFW